MSVFIQNSPGGTPAPSALRPLAGPHLPFVPAGRSFVTGKVNETLHKWFTLWMRVARAFGRDTGGRRHAAKTSATMLTTIPQRIFLAFIDTISEVRQLANAVPDLIDTGTGLFVQSKSPNWSST